MKNPKLIERKFFSIKLASQFSGLSERFLYQRCKDREIRHFRVNKKILIAKEDLIEFVTQNEVRTGEQLREEIRERRR